jgi:ferrous iron transport protein A
MRMILNSDIPVKLGDLTPGESGEIIGFCIEDDLQGFLHRLYEIGFLVGERLDLIQEAPLSHDPISIKVKDAVYAMRREDANLIQVRKI